ncbi:cobyrinate a,c-diamide synthase [Dactylosporangium sp. CA-092794]|uniref:cobyrinate a,c-diamide synthase n=1 Tax=Dactylosporangium sp. CA-092794 TaxID=3239929 RepID=UPI003D936459
MSTIPRLVISAPSSGHGKTAVSVGLLAALTARGYRAAGFKIGPDHVDAAYLGLAAGRPGRNLDPRMVGAKRMGPLFAHGAASLDIAVVEGTMGLFDGLAGRTDSESTAQISGLLRAPVILVVDVGAMGQSVAALVHGFRAYDELLWLGGVILNRVASSRHEQLLREALDDIGVPVLGALRRHALTDVGDAGAPLPSRHHGVAPVVHHNIDAVRAVRRLGEVIAGAVDIDRTMALARSAPRLTSDAWNPEAELAEAGASDAAFASLASTRIGRRPVIGVAFAYPETAELLTAAGAEVVPFDPLRDEALPTGVDGLVIGAALPESYAEELTFNGRLRSAVAAHAAAGKPIAAEGTGLVWLCRDYNGRPMCGVLDASARETDLVVLGYREATARSSSVLLPVGAQVIGHKMHRTSVTPRSGLQAAWTWAGGPAEGFVQRGVHASYLGLHWAGTPSIATRFVAAAGATAAPAPGQWSTPSTSPYGRPSVPLMTFPTAPVTGVPAAAGTPSYAASYTTPEPPAPPRAPIPGSVLAHPAGPGSIAAAAPVSASAPFAPTSAPAAAVSGAPAAAVAGGGGVAGSAGGGGVAGSAGGGGVAGSAGGGVAGGAVGGVAGAAVIGGGGVGGGSEAPANAPTSPGASSPFGPALGPAIPTPWTSPTPPDPAALTSSPSSYPASAARAVPSAPASSLPAALVVPASAVPASSAAPASAVPGSSAVPASGVPGSSVAPASAVPGSSVAPASGGPGSFGAPVPGVSAASAPGVPGAAGAPATGGPAVEAAPSDFSDEAGESDISHLPGLAGSDAVWPADAGDRGRAAAGLPAAGLIPSGPWSSAPDDEATTVLPAATSVAAGDTPPGATDEASVGVPSAANAPATISGLPSSGVVPTATQPVSSAPPAQPVSAGPLSAAHPVSSGPLSAMESVSSGLLSAAQPVSSGPLSDAESVRPVSSGPLPGAGSVRPVSSGPLASVDAVRPVSSGPLAAADAVRPVSAGPLAPAVSAVEPVWTAPVGPERGGAATSAAMPVSSAPMPQVTAPVSAAPGGVTAMPAAESELVAGEPGEASEPLAEQAPVSAPPVSAPPSSAPPVSVSVNSGTISGAPVSGAGSAGSGSVVSGSMPPVPAAGSTSDLSGSSPVSAPPSSLGGAAGERSGGDESPAGGSNEAA